MGRLFGMNLGGSITLAGSLEGVADNPRGDTQSIQYLSPAGSRSDSTLGPAGVELTMRSPVDIGRRGESVVIDRVISQLRADGRAVSLLSHEDQRGEDRKIDCDGENVTIQVIGVPGAPTFLAEVSRGSASTSVSLDGSIDWIADAVSKKAELYPSFDRRNMLLAIDVRAVGVLVSPPVTTAIGDGHGDLCQKSGFGGIWLVGPSDSRCTRLGSSRW